MCLLLASYGNRSRSVSPWDWDYGIGFRRGSFTGSPSHLGEVSRRLTCPFKVVLVDLLTGAKTSLALRYVTNHFDVKQTSTLGAASLTHTIKFDNNKVRYDIWNTESQEIHSTGRQMQLIHFVSMYMY